MKTFYSPAHLAHAPAQEFEMGRMGPAVEVPEPVVRVRAELEEGKLGAILAPAEFPDDAILRVHDAKFVAFLAAAYSDWRARYPKSSVDAIPSVWPARGLRISHADIESRLGAYAFDTATPI